MHASEMASTQFAKNGEIALVRLWYGDGIEYSDELVTTSLDRFDDLEDLTIS